MITHTYPMLRMEGLECLDALAVVRFQTNEPDRDKAWEAFKRAVHQWVLDTEAGRSCWYSSSQDLNVGDLLNASAASDAEFIRRCRKEGLWVVQIISLNQYCNGDHRSYDEHLAREDDLPLLCEHTHVTRGRHYVCTEWAVEDSDPPMCPDHIESCIRCGDPLDSPESKQTGICPDCWTPEDFLEGEGPDLRPIPGAPHVDPDVTRDETD